MTDEQKFDVLTQLHAGVCNVTFTKINGDERTMPCTLKLELLPAMPVTESAKKERKHNPLVASVFCTDKNEWRSFRWENLISIEQVA